MVALSASTVYQVSGAFIFMHIVTLTPNSHAILTHNVKMKVKAGNSEMKQRVGDRVIFTVPLTHTAEGRHCGYPNHVGSRWI